MWHNNLNGVDFSTYDTFKRSVEGQGWDLDGYYGAQCWDGCDMVYAYLGRRLATARYFDENADGYVYTCWTWEQCRNLNGSAPFSLVTNKADLKKGDIIIWSSAIGFVAGHCGYANEDYNGTNEISTLSQNYHNSNLNTGSAFSIDSISLSAFLGAFRWSAWNGTKPPDPPEPTPPSFTTSGGSFPWVLVARKLRDIRQGEF